MSAHTLPCLFLFQFNQFGRVQLIEVQWLAYMTAKIQGMVPHDILTIRTCTNSSGCNRDSTVERVIELHEEGTAIEDIPSGYESLSQRNHSSYIPVSDVQYANSSSTYYAPAQTATTSYWPEQDPTWNTQYTTPSSSSYDASYYNNSMTQTRGESYDAGYYSTEYSATYPQQGSWYATASSDARSFVQNDTTYENFDDPTISSSRQNSDGVHYSYPGASSSWTYLVTLEEVRSIRWCVYW